MTHSLTNLIVHHGYLAVFVLMVLESACLPIPSELVMVLGGALAGRATVFGAHHHLNVVTVGLLGAAGNVVGSLIALEVGRRGGRPLLERYGRYVLIRRHDLDRAEQFFARRGQVAVLIGRLLPVVRTFISLAAGVARMRRGPFVVLTAVGCLPWTMGLSLAGWAVADHWKGVASAFTPISIVVAVILVAFIGRLYVLRRRSARSTASAAQ